MGQLEDLQRNRLARMQHIQKGFCGDDTEDDIVKAHNVGDVHPNHPDWVWTQLPNGKYDWRVRKGQAKPAPTPAPKPSGEPDFTPQIPSEISKLTNRSDWDDFDAAYSTLGAAIVKEKYPTPADVQKYIQDNNYSGIKTQADMERRLGREEAGDYSRYGYKPFSKTAQIAAMKKYYEDKAVMAKKAYQEKKNADYWAGEGKKRKDEIEKERNEQVDIRKKEVADATAEVQTLFGKNTGYKLEVTLDDYGSYKLGVIVDDNRTWDSITLDVRRDIFSKNKDFKTELRYASMTCDCSEPDEVKRVQNLFHCGNLIMQNTDKIKDIIIKHGAVYAEAGKKLDALNAELKKNH
jgi:hypothetical protein